MARLIESAFNSYELTAQEELQGRILSQYQKLRIQNLLAEKANLRINLLYNASDPSVFLQDEASLKGYISLLQFLLEDSKQAELEAEHLNQPDQPEE